MQKNSAQVWDKVWADPGLGKDDVLLLETEMATIRWRKIRNTLKRQFKSLNGLQILEIGSGIGTYAALLAKEGCKATVLDYSPKALKRAKEFFTNNNLSVTTIEGDALDLPSQLKTKKFDITISIGVTEHFKDKKRMAINKVHLSLLKPHGLAVISVPNAYNPPYRIFKWLSEITGTWKFGEEYPYTRSELKNITKKLSAKCVALFGDDFYSSIKFLLPANFLRRFFKVGTPRSKAEIRHEKGTMFDDYMGYCLILVMKRGKIHES